MTELTKSNLLTLIRSVNKVAQIKQDNDEDYPEELELLEKLKPALNDEQQLVPLTPSVVDLIIEALEFLADSSPNISSDVSPEMLVVILDRYSSKNITFELTKKKLD